MVVTLSLGMEGHPELWDANIFKTIINPMYHDLQRVFWNEIMNLPRIQNIPGPRVFFGMNFCFAGPINDIWESLSIQDKIKSCNEINQFYSTSPHSNVLITRYPSCLFSN